MQNETTGKTLLVALSVCLVCSILVSATAVSLRGIQNRNRELDKLKNILDAGGIETGSGDLKEIYNERISPILVDLETGNMIQDSGTEGSMTAETFDIKRAAQDEKMSRLLPADSDVAQIRRIPKNMVIYRVLDGDTVSGYIFPVYGKGLWSTMYGFLALTPDLKTVAGFTYYEHGETPGLGGEVDNPAWKRKWIGKHVYDAEGNVILRVVKGLVESGSPESEYSVDGLSGSTLTSRGVDNTIKFWLGEDGYGPAIKALKGAE